MRLSSRLCGVGAVFIAALVVAPVADAEWQKGVDAFTAKDYGTAVEEFQEVTETNPDYAGAYFMLGQAQSKAGQMSPALGNLRRAIELDGSNPQYAMALGQALVQARQYQEGFTVLKDIERNALNAQQRSIYALLYAKAATEINRPGDAARMLGAQIQSDSQNYRLHQALGVANDANGDDRSAFQSFKRGYELKPDDSSLGRSAARSAIAVARRSSSSQEKTRYYVEAGQLAEKVSNSTRSFDDYLLAGEAWLGAKRYESALTWFGKAQAQQSQNALVYFYRGQCYSSLNQFDNSLNELQQSLKFGPTGKLRRQLYNQLGYVYSKQRSYDNAINAYREAGNTAKVAEIQGIKGAHDQNVQAEADQREYERKMKELEEKMKELEELGGGG